MNTDFKDYYKILEVDRKATEQEIKTAYRKAARKYHPDLHTKSEKTASEEKFREINEANSVLSDAGKRAQYDDLVEKRQNGQKWQAPPPDTGTYDNYTGGGMNANDFSDFFASMFGREGTDGSRRDFRQERRTRGQDIESELELTMAEAYLGGQKTIQFSIRERCPGCGGTGSVSQKICQTCSGTGTKTVSKILDVKIPRFIRDGNKIRLKGQGGEGFSDGDKGDLLLTVIIRPDADFILKGNDLETAVTINPEQAVLGCKIFIKTIDGKVKVTIPPMFHNGQKLRLKSKGWPDQDGNRGDEYVKIMIDIPDSLMTTEQEIYQHLADMKKEVRKP